MNVGPKISFITANYYNEDDTLRFANTALNQLISPSPVIHVVNCGSTPEGIHKLKHLARQAPNVMLHSPGSNLGYYGAAHWCIECCGAAHDRDWVIVCNADIELPDCGFLKALHDRHDCNSTGVIAPSIMSTHLRADQNPFLTRRPTATFVHCKKWMELWHGLAWAQKCASRAKWAFRRRPHDLSHDPARRNIYAGHGAFMVFARRFFTDGGTIHHPPFLYGEEITVAEEARRLDLTIIYDPALRVLHHEHGSTARADGLDNHKAEAAAYCADTFFPLLGRRAG